MKSSVKHTQNFGLVKGMYNGLKHWLSKAKLFFIRSVANSKNPPLCDKSDVINSQILVLDQYYNLTKEVLKKSGKIEKSTIEPFLITLVKIDHFTDSNSIEFLKNHYIDKIENLPNKSDIYSGALKPESGFYTPKEVIETLLKVMENPKFNQNTLANHLSILSIAFSKSQHYQNEELGNKFYRDLYQLCQNHISNQKVTREK